MTDHHDDHHHGEDHDGDGIPERSAHGVPPPPSDEELERYQDEDHARRGMGAGRPSTTVPPHHFFQGPKDVIKVSSPYLLTMRDGSKQKITHKFRWFLADVRGTTRAKALRRLYDHLKHPKGWSQSGIHFVRVYHRENAQIIVRVIPKDETVCGPGSAGCYSYGYESDGKPAAEVGVEYIDREGPWNVLVGMELCGHGAVRMDDGYLSPHQPYYGSMGTWKQAAAVGYLPVPAEIQSAKDWLNGAVPAERIHRH